MTQEFVLRAVVLALYVSVLFKIADGYASPTMTIPASCFCPSSEMVSDGCIYRNIGHPMNGVVVRRTSPPVGGPYPQHLLSIVLQSGMKLPFSLYHAILKSYTDGGALSLYDSNTVSEVEGLRNLIARYGNSKNAMVTITEQSRIPVDVYIQAVMSTLNKDVTVEQPNGVCYPYHLYLKRYGTRVQPRLPQAKHADRHKTNDSKPTPKKAESVVSKNKQSHRDLHEREPKYYPVSPIQRDRYDNSQTKKNPLIEMKEPGRDTSVVTEKFNQHTEDENLKEGSDENTSGEDYATRRKETHFSPPGRGSNTQSEDQVAVDGSLEGYSSDENTSGEEEDYATRRKETHFSPPGRGSNRQSEDQVAVDGSLEGYSSDENTSGEEEDYATRRKETHFSPPERGSNTQSEDQVAVDGSLEGYSAEEAPEENGVSNIDLSSQKEGSSQHSNPSLTSSNRVRPLSSNLPQSRGRSAKAELETIQHSTSHGSPSSRRVNAEDTDNETIGEKTESNKDRDGFNKRTSGKYSHSETETTGRVRRFKSNDAGLQNCHSRRYSTDSTDSSVEDLPSSCSDHQYMASRSWDLNSATGCRQSNRAGDHPRYPGRRTKPEETGYYSEECRDKFDDDDESHYYVPKYSHYHVRRRVNRNTDERQQIHGKNGDKSRHQISGYHPRDSHQDSSENQDDYNQLSAQKQNFIKMITGSDRRHTAGQTDVRGFSTGGKSTHRTGGYRRSDITSSEDEDRSRMFPNHKQGERSSVHPTFIHKHQLLGAERKSSADFEEHPKSRSSENERNRSKTVTGSSDIENEKTPHRYTDTNVLSSYKESPHQSNRRTQENVHRHHPRFPESSRTPASSHKGQVSTISMFRSSANKESRNNAAYQDIPDFEVGHEQSESDISQEKHDLVPFKSSVQFGTNTLHERNVNSQKDIYRSKLLHQERGKHDLTPVSVTKSQCEAGKTKHNSSDQHHRISEDNSKETSKKQSSGTITFPGDELTHGVIPESDGHRSKHAHEDDTQLPDADSKSTEKKISHATKTSTSAEEEDSNESKKNSIVDVLCSH